MASQDSTQVALIEGAVPGVNPVHQWKGRERIFYFDFAQSGVGADGDSARLVRIPAGKVRVVLAGMTHIRHSALGAGRTLDLGWEEHRDGDGNVVAADPNGLASAIDVSGGGAIQFDASAADQYGTHLFDSQEGVTLTATINGGTIPDGGLLAGFFSVVND